MEDFRDEFCTVVCIDGVHLIRTPKGELLKGLIFTRVTDDGKQPIMIVKMYCNIENSITEIQL